MKTPEQRIAVLKAALLMFGLAGLILMIPSFLGGVARWERHAQDTAYGNSVARHYREYRDRQRDEQQKTRFLEQARERLWHEEK